MKIIEQTMRTIDLSIQFATALSIQFATLRLLDPSREKASGPHFLINASKISADALFRWTPECCTRYWSISVTSNPASYRLFLQHILFPGESSHATILENSHAIMICFLSADLEFDIGHDTRTSVQMSQPLSWFVKYPSVFFCWLLCSVSLVPSGCIHRFHSIISRARRNKTCLLLALCDQLTERCPQSSEVLRWHWDTDAPIVPASLIQRQAWTDIPRL